MARLTRRHILRQGTGLFLTLTPVGAALARPASPARPLAIHTWLASAYTRVTLGSNHSMKYQHFTLNDPNRLIVDIQGVEINSVLQGISNRALSDDPLIRSIRAGQDTSNTVHIVIDLKQSTHPQVFALAPVSNSRSRSVINLYPCGADANGSMMALLNSSVPKRRSSTNTTCNTPTPKNNRGSGSNRHPVIMLNPDHGGEDPDAIGPNGLREKNVVFSIARKAKKRLEALDYNIFMACNEDIFIPLGIRVTKGRTCNADVFVSIHADAFTSPSACDTGVHILNTKGTTSSAAKFLAQTQNSANVIGGIQTNGNHNVDNAILDTAQTATLCDSRKLGHLVLTELGKLNRLHKGRIDETNFAVLHAPDVPSILVETAFLSNPTEERLLGSESFH